MWKSQRDPDQEARVDRLLFLGITKLPFTLPCLFKEGLGIKAFTHSFDYHGSFRRAGLPAEKSYMGAALLGGWSFAYAGKEKLEALSMIMNKEIGLETMSRNTDKEYYLFVNLRDPNAERKLKALLGLNEKKLGLESQAACRAALEAEAKAFSKEILVRFSPSDFDLENVRSCARGINALAEEQMLKDIDETFRPLLKEPLLKEVKAALKECRAG